MGIFDFAKKKPDTNIEKVSKGPKASKEKIKCSKCGKISDKAFYDYPGKKKGSLEITQEEVLCSDCWSKVHQMSDTDPKKSADIILAMQLKDPKKLKAALKELDSTGSETDQTYYYTRANVLANMGQHEEALENYDDAILLDTHYIKAWYRKGWMLLGLATKAQLKTQKSLSMLHDSLECFENVITLESWMKDAIKYAEDSINSGQLNSDSFMQAVVKNGKDSWSPAALLTQTYALMVYANAKAGKITQEEGRKAQTHLVYSYMLLRCYPSIAAKMPSQQLNQQYFRLALPDFILPNVQSLLNVIEPRVVAHIGLQGERH